MYSCRRWLDQNTSPRTAAHPKGDIKDGKGDQFGGLCSTRAAGPVTRPCTVLGRSRTCGVVSRKTAGRREGVGVAYISKQFWLKPF